MAKEHLGALQEWQSHRSEKPYVMAFPGASTIYSAAIGMNSVWGPTIRDAWVPNSPVNLSIRKEPPDKDRYKTAVDIAKTQIDQGREITVDAGSIGAGEFCAFMDELDKIDSGWLEQNKEKFHLVLRSPTAPKNKLEAIKYLVKYAGPVVLQEASAIPFVVPLPRKTRILRDLQLFATFPPVNFNDHAEEYTEGLRRVAKKISQASRVPEGIEKKIYEPDPQRNFINVLPEGIPDRINELDTKLLSEMKLGNDKEVRKLLRKRGRLTQPESNNVYGGKHAAAVGDQPREVPQVKSSKEGKRLRRELLLNTFWRTNIFDRLSQLADRGFKMTIVVPEFDVLFDIERALELADGRDNVRVVFSESTTHAFPPGSHPENSINVFEFPKAA